MKRFLSGIILCFAFISCLQSYAASEEMVRELLDKQMDVLKQNVEPDTAKYYQTVRDVLALANQIDDNEAKIQAYFYWMTNLSSHGEMEKAVELLNQSKQCYLANNRPAEKKFYDGWNNLVVAYQNQDNLIKAVNMANDLVEFSKKDESNYGKATAHQTYGTLFNGSYDVAIDNYKRAIEYYKKADVQDAFYYVYYCMALAAFRAQNFDDMLAFVEQMENSETEDVEYAQQLAAYLKTLIYLEKKDKKSAKENYDKLRDWSIHGEIHGSLASSVAETMAMYQFEYGTASAGMKILHEFGFKDEEIAPDLMEGYYESQGMYKEALQERQKFDKILLQQWSKQQLTELASANAQYNLTQIESEKQQLELENMRKSTTLMYVIIAALVVALILIIYIVRQTLRHNKRLKEERDLTELARQKAVRLNDLKSEFLHNISHQVRTPLNHIIGFNNVINAPGMTFSEEQKAEMLSQINDSSEQLLSLFDEVLFLTRMDCNDMEVHMGEVDLGQICQEAWEMKSDKLAEGVKAQVERSFHCGFKTQSDSYLLTLAVSEVLENSVKFTVNGTISMRCEASPAGGYDITICDNSPYPIPPEDSERIYERFEKLRSYDTGFGLGLAISRESLALIGGTITLISSTEEGTAFRIHVP